MSDDQRKRRKRNTNGLTALRQKKLDEAVLAYGRAWSELQRATAQKNLTSTETIELLESLGLKQHVVEASSDNGPTGSVSVSIVKGERVHIDWEKFKKKAGANVWKKITKSVPDQGLVDQAIADGLFTLEDLAECSSTIANSPYLRTNVKGVL